MGFPEEAPPNHVLVNYYEPGAGIPFHKDGFAYHPTVASLSLGAGLVFDFLRSTGEPPRKGAIPDLSLVLPPRGLLIFNDSAYHNYAHGIAERRLDDLKEEALANWNSSRRDAWIADGWLKKQLVDLREDGTTLLRAERFSLTFHHTPLRPPDPCPA